MHERDLYRFFTHLAHESGKVINPHFANPCLKVELKADFSPVTIADRRAEETMRTLIAREFPQHGIIGEEFGEQTGQSEYAWILDPIDGTRSFAAGSPHFGTLICLTRNSIPVWGAIHLPALGQLFIGDGTSCWRNDQPVRIPEPPPLQECFLLTTDPKSPPRIKNAAGWAALLEATDQFRSWGDCFGYTLLINGGAHIMTDPILNLWDVAALLPVLSGAGITASTWEGRPVDTADSLVAAHPRIHQTIISLLNPES